jgi:signal peptidase II
MNSTIRAAVVLSIILGCVGCDQLTKAVARDHLQPQETISLLNDTVRLQRAENPGAFLSLGDALPSSVRRVVFTFGGVLLVAGAAFWALRSQRLTSLQIAGAALVAGGGFSNLIDRVTQGGTVTDFLNVGVGPIRTGIFNCADMALMLGIAILVIGDGLAKRALPRR